MRTLACYAEGLRRQTYLALVQYIPVGSLELVNVSAGVFDYWYEIKSRWRGEFDLMIVEQDNVIQYDTYGSFLHCSHPWCSFQYIVASAFQKDFLCDSMGCAKFSAQLQRDVPIDVISEVELPWHYIDLVIGDKLRELRYTPHTHGTVEHLHDYGDPDPAALAKAQQLISRSKEYVDPAQQSERGKKS